MGKQRKALIWAVIAGLATSLLHYSAVTFYLYWTYQGFDKVVHFVAGAFVGFVFSWIYLNIYDQNQRVRPAIFVILSVMLAGLGWELFEVLAKTTSVLPSHSYFVDTITDLIADLVGGVVAYVYIFIPHKHITYENS